MKKTWLVTNEYKNGTLGVSEIPEFLCRNRQEVPTINGIFGDNIYTTKMTIFIKLYIMAKGLFRRDIMRSKCCWGYIWEKDGNMSCAQCGKVNPETISDHEIARLKKQYPEKYGDHPYIPFHIPDGDR